MKLLRDKSPNLRVEWDSVRNQELQLEFDKVSSGAKQRAYWTCSKDPRHRWLAQVRDRSMGRGCPFCSGLQTLRDDSLAFLRPDLLTQWHPTKNEGIDPFKIAPGSSKSVWWICEKYSEHTWSTKVHVRNKKDSGCPYCRKQPGTLAMRAPHLVKQWHPTKNLPQSPETIGASARIKVWWQCETNPDHVWLARVDGRVRVGGGCPTCSRKQLGRKHRPLSEFFPKLSSEWHSAKNGNLSPEDVTSGSNQRVWWRCSTVPSHEWQAPIKNRTRLNRGCPKCAWRSKHPTNEHNLASKFPVLAKQWHPDKNGELRPQDVTPGSMKRIWWQCLAEAPHVWQSTVCNRTTRQPDGRCPKCTGSVSEKNSLAAVHAEIATEWHPSKNGMLTPAGVSRASGKLVWWQCPKNPNHEWEAIIRNRTIQKTGCPECEAEGRSLRQEQSLLDASLSNVDYEGTFRRSMTGLRTLLKQMSPNTVQLRQSFYRMLYASAITALETFLSDAFLQEVIPHRDKMEKVLLTAPELSERKYSLSDVVSWNANLHQQVTKYLSDIIWHNLNKVTPMYFDVLGITFPKNGGPIYRAIILRHDLVHRTGRTKDYRAHILSVVELTQLFDDVEGFVKHITAQIRSSAK